VLKSATCSCQLVEKREREIWIEKRGRERKKRERE
jgi:hypothetical protein